MKGRNYIRTLGEVPDQNLRARGIRRQAKRADRRMSHCGGVEGLTGATMGESPTSDSWVEERTGVTRAASPTFGAGLSYQDQPQPEYSENNTSGGEEEIAIMFRNHDMTPKQRSAQIWDKYRRDFPRTCRLGGRVPVPSESFPFFRLPPELRRNVLRLRLRLKIELRHVAYNHHFKA